MSTMTEPKYPDITVQLTGNDGNAFAIMGAVANALHKNHVPREDIDLYRAESMKGDYDRLLQTAMAWVDVQ